MSSTVEFKAEDHQSAAANTLDSNVDAGLAKHTSIVLADSSINRCRCKQYRLRIEELEAELRKCKQESDSLIDDLRETKTKVAVLEESKAQL